MNNDLRATIARMVHRAGDGHIPSAYSIVDMVAILYRDYLRVDPRRPQWAERDYFVLSKGHGCLALYVVLAHAGFLRPSDLERFCTAGGILGEHPDCTKVPGVEASTGSLGHGLPFAAGIALGLRIAQRSNRVFVLVGDGECHEGAIWESANLVANLELGNLCLLVDWNGSAAQLLPRDDLPAKWRAFGWRTCVIDGHDEGQIRDALDSVPFAATGTPTAIIARTVKGKGVAMLEGHGTWHHRIPTDAELAAILEALQ